MPVHDDFVLQGLRGQWSKAQLSTAPVDRAKAEEAVARTYRVAGLAPPERIVWCSGPIAAAKTWNGRRHGALTGANVRHTILDRIQMQVGAKVRASTTRENWLAAVTSTRTREMESLGSEVSRIVSRAADRACGRGAAGLARLLGSLLDFKRTTEPWLSFARASFSPHDLTWIGAYKYLSESLGLERQVELLSGLWPLGLEAAWIIPHERICWLSERPAVLAHDIAGRLHCGTGPALAFADGWSAYCWKGIEVPAEFIERRDSISLEQIDEIRDVVLRRCMIEILTPKRFIAMGGANLVAHDDTGVLWRRAWWNGDAWAAVEVVNGTPEPDGRRQTYVLQVPPEMRSARAAVAWTYGISEHEYAKLQLRT